MQCVYMCVVSVCVCVLRDKLQSSDDTRPTLVIASLSHKLNVNHFKKDSAAR